MNRHLFLLVFLCPGLALAENLFKNSAMDTTLAWKGERGYETVDGNRVCVLTAKKNKAVELSQSVAAKGLKDVSLKFRYQTADYAGRGLTLRIKRNNGGSTYRTIQLQSDGAWHDYTWDITEVRGSNQVEISLELLDGSGKVFFDDVTLDSK